MRPFADPVRHDAHLGEVERATQALRDRRDRLIIRIYVGGANVCQTAAALGISHEGVYTVLRARGEE